MMLSWLYWTMLRRHMLRLSLRNFFASAESHVTSSVTFEGYNTIYGKCCIRTSSFGLFSYASDARIINATIGRFCSIGPEAMIGGLGRHPSCWVSTHPAFYSESIKSGLSFSDSNYYEENVPVTIGNDVWVGARAIVLDGVTIGDGAVIAAGAVVAADVEPYMIVGGIPAKPIRKRLGDETIDYLIKLQWWNWPVDQLKQAAPIFRNADEREIRQFLQNRSGN